MSPWDLDVNLRFVVLDFLYLSAFLMIGTVLRRYVKFFQKYLIPNNLIAGFLALLIGSQGIGLIDLQSERLILYVYHLLALTFIALGLRQSKTNWGKGPVSKSIASLTSYIIQGSIGLIVALILVHTIAPDLFIGIGLLIPLGFGMGPGLAAALGGGWDDTLIKLGYEAPGAAQIGLTFATIGYLYAFFGGMALIQWGIRTGKSKLITNLDSITNDMRRGVYKDGKPPIAGKLPLTTEAIEPLAFQLSLIGLVYLATWLIVKWLTGVMTAGNDQLLVQLANTVWSFHFVVGLLLSLIVRKILDMTGRGYVIDKGLMNRGMGVFLDFLIMGAVAAISLKIVLQNWEAILIMSLLAGPATGFMLYYVTRRAFDDYHFERFIELWGEMTGTINSALVLLRVTDPEFETPVAEDAVYGGGISLFLGLPLLFTLNIPIAIYENAIEGYWVTLGILIGYGILLWIVWRAIGFIKFGKPKV
jgi:ESS family glutamate:Na+ symporter